MLNSLRNASGGIVAKIFLGILVISFAVWGASGAFVGGVGGDAVKVGSTRVSPEEYRLAYQNRLNSLEGQLNQRLTREQAKALGVDKAVLEQMISGAVLDENANAMGLGVSQETLAAEIGADPTFRDGNGRFSRERLSRLLRSIGMSEEAYIRNQEASATRRQFVDGVTAGVAMPDAFFDAFSRYQSERRVFDYVIIDKTNLPAPAEPAPDQLNAYYEANKASYMAPEYRKLIVVRLMPEDLAKPEAVTDDELTAEYEATKQKYGQPEQRKIEQLTFPDSTAAKAAADRLAAGETFEAIMTDQGKSAADIDLGMLAKSQIPDQAISDAAFSLSLNTPSGVVDGVFGPVILRVTEIQPESVKPLADVGDEIRKAVALRKASDEVYEMHDKLEDERAAGETLADAAGKVGLTPRTIEQVDATGKAPDGTPVAEIPESAKVLSEAFQTDEGVEADPVSIGTEGFVWYEVAGTTPERQKPLEEVRDAALAAYLESETARRIAETAVSIRDRVEKGEELSAVVAELLSGGEAGAAPAVEQSAEMTRTDTGRDLSKTAVTAGFSAPLGNVLVTDGPQAPQKMVMKIARVLDGADIPVGLPLRERLDSQLSEDLLSDLVQDLRSREDVVVNPSLVESATGF